MPIEIHTCLTPEDLSVFFALVDMTPAFLSDTIVKATATTGEVFLWTRDAAKASFCIALGVPS